ncbi:MAG: hypothetical protein Q8L54_03905 [Devosia sp.]|nr:hypothetical protein [Devosia sp.]
MINVNKTALFGIVLAGVLATPASAASLLGGLLEGNADGAVTDGGAGTGGAVNVGLAAGSDQPLSLNLGGDSTGGAFASVGTGGVDGGLDLGTDLLGLDLDLDGTPGADGSRLLASLAAADASCAGTDGRQVLQLAASVRYDAQTLAAWRRAANVQVVPIRLCPAVRKQVAAILARSGVISNLQAAVASDALITASLNRTRYDVSDVFAVTRTGSQLTVYVF